MFSSTKQLMLSTAAVALVMSFAFAAQAGDKETININLAVASNFFGDPPINSAITDVINAFEFANPQYTVTVVDNGATATLAEHIIDGNERGADLFLAADTDTPQDLLINHFDLVAPYNSSLTVAIVRLFAVYLTGAGRQQVLQGPKTVLDPAATLPCP